MAENQCDWPLVSVLILTYQHERYIASCIKSVRAIDYPRLELHVLDDGSSDNTVLTAKEAAAHTTFPIHIASQPHSFGKTAANSNTLLSLAQGKYVLFLSGDDALAPGYALREIVSAFEATPSLALALPRVVHVHMDDCTIHTSIYTPKFCTILRSGDPDCIWHDHLCKRVSRLFLQGAVMPRDACSEFGGFDAELAADDYAFMVRAFVWMRQNARSFTFFENHIWLYRVHGHNSHASSDRQRRLVFEVVSKYIPSKYWEAFEWDHQEPIDYDSLRSLCEEVVAYFGGTGLNAFIPSLIRRFLYRALNRHDIRAIGRLLTWREKWIITLPFLLPRVYRLLLPPQRTLNGHF